MTRRAGRAPVGLGPVEVLEQLDARMRRRTLIRRVLIRRTLVRVDRSVGNRHPHVSYTHGCLSAFHEPAQFDVMKSHASATDRPPRLNRSVSHTMAPTNASPMTPARTRTTMCWRPSQCHHDSSRALVNPSRR